MGPVSGVGSGKARRNQSFFGSTDYQERTSREGIEEEKDDTEIRPGKYIPKSLADRVKEMHEAEEIEKTLESLGKPSPIKQRKEEAREAW